MIVKRLVAASVSFVLRAVAQERLVELSDVVLSDGHVRPCLEDQIHRLGIARDFLFVAGLEALGFEVGEERFDLCVCKLRTLDPGG